MTRKEKLARLIDDRFEGNQAELARAIGRSPSLVWQYLSGHREMGEKFARHVERKLRIATGWLDQSTEVKETPAHYLPPTESRILAWDSLDDLPDKSAYVTVPHHAVHLSAGDGADAQWLEHADSVPLVFHARFFQARGIQPGRCRALYVRGASMEPTLQDGDTVLIDTARTQVEDDAIFAVLYHGELYIKRLFRLPGGGLELRSDNERHPTREIHGEDLNRMIILGRMIWRAG